MLFLCSKPSNGFSFPRGKSKIPTMKWGPSWSSHNLSHHYLDLSSYSSPPLLSTLAIQSLWTCPPFSWECSSQKSNKRLVRSLSSALYRKTHQGGPSRMHSCSVTGDTRGSCTIHFFFLVAFTTINLLYTLLNSLAYYLFSSSHRFVGLCFTQFFTLWYIDKECFLGRFHTLP